MGLPKVIISADSHVAENEDAFKDIDPKFRDRAPKAVEDDVRGAGMMIDGMPQAVPMGMICTAGRKPEDIGKPMFWNQVNPAGFDSSTRLDIQDQDGIHAEIIYPSVGMILALHPDWDYKKACFDAYNRWLAQYCEKDTKRLIGMPQIALRTIDEGIKELEEIKAMGFKGVMLCGDPKLEDYDHPIYDPFWEACVALDLPVCFHILTSKKDVDVTGQGLARGPKICEFMNLIRGNQDIMAMFVFGGVFERHPKLRLVSVESDASWAPHFCSRMDHAYNHHRFGSAQWAAQDKITRAPSEYFKENIYLTIQDDMPVGQMTNVLEMDKILWANDFPHSDGIWLRSQDILTRMTKDMSEQHKEMLLHDNVATLFKLEI